VIWHMQKVLSTFKMCVLLPHTPIAYHIIGKKLLWGTSWWWFGDIYQLWCDYLTRTLFFLGSYVVYSFYNNKEKNKKVKYDYNYERVCSCTCQRWLHDCLINMDKLFIHKSYYYFMWTYIPFVPHDCSHISHGTLFQSIILAH
jgi:hypothetical protein